MIVEPAEDDIMRNERANALEADTGRRLQRRLSSITIRNKLLILFGVFALLLFALCLRFSMRMSDAYMEHFNQIAEANQAQLITNIRVQVQKWSDTLDMVFHNTTMYEYLSRDDIDQYSAYLEYSDNIYPVLSTLTSGALVEDIRVYSENRCLSISSLTNNSQEQLEQYSWYDEPQQGFQWRYVSVKRAYLQKDYLYCSRSRQIVYRSGKTGLVTYVIFVNPQRLETLFSEEKEAGMQIFLIDDAGVVFQSTKHEYINRSMEDLPDSLAERLTTDTTEEDTSLDTVSMDGTTYRVSMQQFSPDVYGLGHWRLVYMAPTSEVNQGIHRAWLEMVGLFLACLTVAGLAVMLITQNLSKRIGAVQAAMARVGQGEFLPSLTEEKRDEIGNIESSFNRMVVRLDELVREASEANNRALKAELNAQILLRMNRESELLLLQHQINPHYLFNTFESIRMELVNEGNRELAGIVFSFAQSFRASLYGGESIYPLADEMRLVYSFISIQEYRHPDRVKFEIEIQDGMEQYVLPKLCIQPLLENAVLHGIEEKEGSGIVRLSVLEENDSILIRVYDNGAGMSEEKLASVRSVIYEEEPVGNDQLERRFSALRNVHWRIVLLYGREYGLNIESRLGEFTEVTLRIAKRLQRGGDDDDEMPDRG